MHPHINHHSPNKRCPCSALVVAEQFIDLRQSWFTYLPFLVLQAPKILATWNKAVWLQLEGQRTFWALLGRAEQRSPSITLTQRQDICALKSSPWCPSNTTTGGVISPPTPDSYRSFSPQILTDYYSPICGESYSALSDLFRSSTRRQSLANFQGLIKGHRELGSKKFMQMKTRAVCVLLLQEMNSNSWNRGQLSKKENLCFSFFFHPLRLTAARAQTL